LTTIGRKKEAPSVLLLDYQLVDGTGIDCANRLADEGIRLRLILLTAHASPDVEKRAFESGFAILSGSSRSSSHERTCQPVTPPARGP